MFMEHPPCVDHFYRIKNFPIFQKNKSHSSFKEKESAGVPSRSSLKKSQSFPLFSKSPSWAVHLHGRGPGPCRRGRPEPS